MMNRRKSTLRKSSRVILVPVSELKSSIKMGTKISFNLPCNHVAIFFNSLIISALILTLIGVNYTFTASFREALILIYLS